MGNLKELHPKSFLYNKDQVAILDAVAEAGFVGVAGLNIELHPHRYAERGLAYASAIVFADAVTGMRSLKEAADLHVSSVTVHLGNGFNADAEVYEWLEKIFSFSIASKIPVMFETHRSTVFQDVYRTLQILKKYPAVRLAADFSHWYTGLLLGNDFDKKISYMDSIFERTATLHGRVSSDGCIQPPLDRLNKKEKSHFEKLWISVYDQSQVNDPTIPFIVELLSHTIGYDPGISSRNEMRESTDRWADALSLKSLMQHWYQKT